MSFQELFALFFHEVRTTFSRSGKDKEQDKPKRDGTFRAGSAIVFSNLHDSVKNFLLIPKRTKKHQEIEKEEKKIRKAGKKQKKKQKRSKKETVVFSATA